MSQASNQLLMIARWMAIAGHDFVQISKTTGLSYAICEALVAYYRPRPGQEAPR